jgi:hypothetical protein
MTNTLKLFVASAALTAAIGLPAWSAMHVSPPGEIAKPLAAVLEGGGDAAQFILVDDDDDGEDDDAKRKQRHSGDDDDDDNDDDDDDDDNDDDCEDDDDGCGSARAPAPAGTVAPPQNGLFSNGTAPKAQVK